MRELSPYLPCTCWSLATFGRLVITPRFVDMYRLIAFDRHQQHLENYVPIFFWMLHEIIKCFHHRFEAMLSIYLHANNLSIQTTSSLIAHDKAPQTTPVGSRVGRATSCWNRWTQRPTYLIRERVQRLHINLRQAPAQLTTKILPEYAHRFSITNPSLSALRPTRGISDKGGPEDDAERLQMLE